MKAALRTKECCIDLETAKLPEYCSNDRATLDPHQSRMGLLIFHTDSRTWLFREWPSWMLDLMAAESIQKVFFNAKFDLQYMIKELGLKIARNLRCLYLDELLVSDYRRGKKYRDKHDLQQTLYRRLGVEVAKDVDHTVVDWGGELSEQMLRYALEDVQYLPPLAQELQRLIDVTGQTRAARIEHDAVLASAFMSYNGAPLDKAGWVRQIRGWHHQKMDREKILREMHPPTKNWNSGPQCHKAIWDVHGIRLPNIQKQTLIDNAEQFPLCKALRDYVQVQTKLKFWGVKWVRKGVNPVTQRIHSTWHQVGTETGRYADTNPNLQQIEHQESVRALFPARPGYLIAGLDYRQIEVLVAAVDANDQTLLDIFNSGEDVHTMIACEIMGLPPEKILKRVRDDTKTIVFGVLFGGGAGNVQRQSHKQGRDMTLEEATKFTHRFFNKFQGLRRRRAEAYSAFDLKPQQMPIYNMVGMRRVLTGADRKATTWLNTRIQSSAGYGIKSAVPYLMEEGVLEYLILQVHDEYVFEFPEDRAEEYANIAKQCMIDGMQEVLGLVPVGVDIAIGKTWS